VHALPGTTFSTIAQRGGYDKSACPTLEELERWIAVAITKYYHLRPHEGLDWAADVQGVPSLARSARATC
jgi:putative transposase